MGKASKYPTLDECVAGIEPNMIGIDDVPECAREGYPFRVCQCLAPAAGEHPNPIVWQQMCLEAMEALGIHFEHALQVHPGPLLTLARYIMYVWQVDSSYHWFSGRDEEWPEYMKTNILDAGKHDESEADTNG